MKCVHTFGTGRHKRQADITFLFQYRIQHWCPVGTENPNPRVHRSSEKRGLQSFSLNGGSRVRIFLEPLNTNDRFFFSHTRSGFPLFLPM